MSVLELQNCFAIVIGELKEHMTRTQFFVSKEIITQKR